MPSTQTVPDTDRAIALVMDYITATPGHNDDWPVHVHRNQTDGIYTATIVYERTEWLSWDVLDTLWTVLEAADLDVQAERLSPYEVAFLA